MKICPFFVKNIFIFGNKGKFRVMIDEFVKEVSIFYQVQEIPSRSVSDIYLSKSIDFEQLEQKYGGNMKNLSIFWPPRCQMDGTKVLRNEVLLKQGLYPFTFDDKKYRIFKNSILGKKIKK